MTCDLARISNCTEPRCSTTTSINASQRRIYSAYVSNLCCLPTNALQKHQPAPDPVFAAATPLRDAGAISSPRSKFPSFSLLRRRAVRRYREACTRWHTVRAVRGSPRPEHASCGAQPSLFPTMAQPPKFPDLLLPAQTTAKAASALLSVSAASTRVARSFLAKSERR